MPVTTIQVRAREGIRFPMEGAPRRYIEATPVEVASSTYYRRAIADGDLLAVALAVAAPATSTPAKSKEK